MNDLEKLSNVISETLKSGEHKNFLQCIVQNVVSLIKNDFFRFNVAKWDQDGDLYLKEKCEFFEKSIIEIEAAALSLIADLQNHELSRNPFVATQLSKVKAVLNEKEKRKQEGELWLSDLYHGITITLLPMVLGFGGNDIVMRYGIIRQSFPMISPFTGLLDRSYISEFTFCPSYKKLQQLEGCFRQQHVKQAWVARKLFLYLEECWSTTNAEDIKNPTIYEHWTELNAIKNETPISIKFFTREKFASCLQALRDDIGDASAVNVLTSIKIPCTIELDTVTTLTYHYLLIIASYSDNHIPKQKKLIHRFRSDSKMYRFIEHLLASSFQNPYSISKGSIIDNLTKAKLNNTIVDKLFFVRPDKDKTHTIYTRSKSIKVKDISVELALELVKYLDGLPDYPPKKNVR